MYKDGKLTITDFVKAQGQSPFVGFGVVRNCEVFDNPGIAKIAKNPGSVTGYSGIEAFPVKRLTASNGDEYLLTSSILSTPGVSSLYRNQTLLTTFTGNPVAYDMIEYKGYILVTLDGNIFAYQLSSGRKCFNWKTGLSTGYYMKILVGQDDIVYITNGNTIASLSSFVAGTVASDPTATLNASALDLPDGQYAVTMVELGNLLLIGTQGGSNWSQRIYQRVANVYPWDRTSASFRIPVQIQEAGVHAMLQVNNVVYVCAGGAGSIYVTDGTSYRKIGRIPWTDDRTLRDYISYLPNAISTNINNNLLIGASKSSGDVDQIGVFEMEISEGYPVCLKQTISTGNFGNTVSIGFISTGAQGETYIGWADGASFGVDQVGVFAYTGFKAVIESPLYRVGTSDAKKTFQHGEYLVAKPLTTSHQIRISYRKNLQDDYTVLGTFTYSSDGSVVSRQFKASIDSAELVQVRIELDQDDFSSPAPEWDLELIGIRLW